MMGHLLIRFLRATILSPSEISEIRKHILELRAEKHLKIKHLKLSEVIYSVVNKFQT
jgi:hypothetical protein